jgi:hypothetical protein
MLFMPIYLQDFKEKRLTFQLRLTTHTACGEHLLEETSLSYTTMLRNNGPWTAPGPLWVRKLCLSQVEISLILN